jgi:MFS family permease
MSSASPGSAGGRGTGETNGFRPVRPCTGEVATTTGPSDSRRIASAATVAVSAAVPPFLVGALAPRLDGDMPFGAAQVATAMAVCFTVAGVLSPLAGRLVARLGVAWSARTACALATVGLLGISAAVAVWQVMVALVVVALANALSQPTSNQLLAHIVAPRRQAFAFGLVQAAIPCASVVAGAALAVTSGGIDWRLTTAVVALATLAAQVVVGRGTVVGETPRPARAADPVPRPGAAPRRSPLLPLVVAGGLASAAATTLPSFTATAGLAQGLTPLGVATAQVVGSLGSVAVRITAPVVVSDVAPRMRYAVMAALMAIGAAGVLLLLASTPTAFVVGVIVGFTFGWGWNGLFNQLVASASPDRVASATGITQAGIFLGGTTGPLVFALIVAGSGFAAAWATMAVLMAAAAAVALAGKPRLPVTIEAQSDSTPFGDTNVTGTRRT